MSSPRWVRHKTKDLVRDETAIFTRRDALEEGAKGHGLVVTSNMDGKFYISPADKEKAETGDRRGPYATLEEACFAADLIIDLNAVPQSWHGT